MKNFKKLTGKKILVTGGAGFIGSNLCEKLLEIGAKVRCYDNFLTGKKENLENFNNNPNFEIIEGDIVDYESCYLATKKIDFVLHQAALGSVPRSIKDPLTTNKINVEGFINILKASIENNVNKFIYASSSSIYGNSTLLPKVENKTGEPLSPYAITKYVNEKYAKVFSSLYGIQTIGLRYFNVFGKRQDENGPYAAVIPRFILSLINHQRPIIYGDGSYSRDFTHVSNVVQMNLKALMCDSLRSITNIYNTACGESTSIIQLFKKIRKVLALRDKLVIDIKPIFESIRKGDVPHSLASIEKAKKDLYYKPITSIDQGIDKTVSWYFNSYNE